MPTLHVRNVPDKLYRHIQKIAEDEGRSLTAEVVQLLDHGIRATESRRGAAALLKRIGKRAQAVDLPHGWNDSSALIREDRGR
ncbi:MAG: FitA-like ribbon-helix-helix domain-containing protein [Rhodanobacteraceae bacterium]